MEYCEVQRRKKDLTDQEVGVLRVKVALGALAGGAAAAFLLLPTGYFGPLSSRVRGLFVQHTKTGNPLVDSVAEHQPARPEAYWHYLHYMCARPPRPAPPAGLPRRARPPRPAEPSRADARE
jgi:dolichyl-diphosphooligosaccharide--protein glycosyltransferase